MSPTAPQAGMGEVKARGASACDTAPGRGHGAESEG